MAIKGGFVDAVKKAIADGSDNWEARYYEGDMGADGHFEWDRRKLPVYMHTRYSALGPEWKSLMGVIAQMSSSIPRITAVRYKIHQG